MNPHGTLPHNAISKTFSICRLDITLKNMSVKSCVCEECAKNAFQAESKLSMTPRKMKVHSHTDSTFGTNVHGTDTQTPESVGTLEPGSKPSMATESQSRLLGIFVPASFGCSWEAFLSRYNRIQNFCLFLLDFWMARSDLIVFYFCLVRGAKIVGSWDPHAEEVETERGNGGKFSLIRAKNGAWSLVIIHQD